MKLIVHPVRLYLKGTFRIAHGTFLYRDAVIVELWDGIYSGYGEATAISYYGKSIDTFTTLLKKEKSFIEGLEWTHPEEFWELLLPVFKNNLFLLCALDVAAWDLWAKRQKKPLYQAWGLETKDLPLSNYTISIDQIENMIRQMQDFPSPIYKIKLGTSEDVAIVRALRAVSDAGFRVDANGAWSASEAIHNSVALKKLGVAFIEQPLPVEDREGMRKVFQESVLPLIADESCQVESDVAACHGLFHGINIKLMKCGGFTPALRMIKEARKRKLKIMCGCMTETSIGISAIAQLLPLLDYVDMDGALLLKNDPATGVQIQNGRVIYPNGNGHGAQLKVSY